MVHHAACLKKHISADINLHPTVVPLWAIIHCHMIITNSMEKNPSSEANSHSACQEIPCLLWNLEVHYRVHNSPPLVPIMCQMYPVHTSHHISLKPILTILSSYLFFGLPSGITPSEFLTKILYAFLISPM